MKDKAKSYFWLVQISMWLIMGVINVAVHWQSHTPIIIELLNTITIFIGGIIVTSVYRWYLKRHGNWYKLKPKRLFLFIFLSTLVVTVAWFGLTIALFLPQFSKYHLTFSTFIPSMVNLYILTLVWTLLYLGINLIKHYHVSEVEKWQLEAAFQKAKLGALKSQINPHFMFNALNNIKALILEDKETARQMITRFADLLRYSLQYSEQKEVTVDEEIYMLSLYFDLLKIQYEEKLDFKIRVPQYLKNKKIPPMILQLLVENAIKHGIALCPAGGKIEVGVEQSTNILMLEVKNTGTLTRNNTLEDSLGVGITNITERLRLLYGNSASLSIQELDSFVSVIIKIEQT